MDEQQLLDQFARIEAEMDTLRARSDVLAIALKYSILNSPNPGQLLEFINQKLSATSDLAVFSSQPSEMYLAAFDNAAERVAGWIEALRPADD